VRLEESFRDVGRGPNPGRPNTLVWSDLAAELPTESADGAEDGGQLASARDTALVDAATGAKPASVACAARTAPSVGPSADSALRPRRASG
jgi:hypothetical protein